MKKTSINSSRSRSEMLTKLIFLMNLNTILHIAHKVGITESSLNALFMFAFVKHFREYIRKNKADKIAKMPAKRRRWWPMR